MMADKGDPVQPFADDDVALLVDHVGDGVVRVTRERRGERLLGPGLQPVVQLLGHPAS